MSGIVGYLAYAESTNGKTHDGRDMLAWEELPTRIQLAWDAAAKAIAKDVYAAVKAANDECPDTLQAPPGYPR